MKKRRKTTAGELMAQLNADREYLARAARREAERDARVAELRRAQAPLIDELRSAGYVVESVWDLVNTSTPYPEALPVLMDHVSRPYPVPVREGIARALAVPGSRFGWNFLARLYRDESEPSVKQGLAAAVAAAADDSVFEDLLALVRDTRHGSSRLLLLSALERSNDPRGRATLMALGTDPDLKKEIQVILRRLKKSKV